MRTSTRYSSFQPSVYEDIVRELLERKKAIAALKPRDLPISPDVLRKPADEKNENESSDAKKLADNLIAILRDWRVEQLKNEATAALPKDFAAEIKAKVKDFSYSEAPAAGAICKQRADELQQGPLGTQLGAAGREMILANGQRMEHLIGALRTAWNEMKKI